MATCNVNGYIVDGSDQPKEGIQIYFMPASLPSVNSSTGRAIHPISVSCVTSSTGYFHIDLLVNTDFIVIINALGMKEKIRIPDAVDKNLFELTGAYISGDPSPVDDGSGERNW